MAIEQNVTADDHWFAGEDKQFQFNVVDSAGNTQVMTGWTLEWVLRRTAASATATLTKTTSNGIAISNGAGTNDRATVTLTDDDTVNLVTGQYEYALRRTDAGTEQVLAYGTAQLLKPATR